MRYWALCTLVWVIGCEGPEGPVGPVGPVGPQGPRGPQGEQSSTDASSALHTNLHATRGAYWTLDGGGRMTIDVDWRFLSHNQLLDAIEVEGSYKLLLTNNSGSSQRVEIGGLSFRDANDLQVAEFDPFPNPSFTIASNQSRETTGNFTIYPGNVDVANAITSMTVLASFTQQ
jgi:hypothetical protein